MRTENHVTQSPNLNSNHRNFIHLYTKKIIIVSITTTTYSPLPPPQSPSQLSTITNTYYHKHLCSCNERPMYTKTNATTAISTTTSPPHCYKSKTITKFKGKLQKFELQPPQRNHQNQIELITVIITTPKSLKNRRSIKFIGKPLNSEHKLPIF